MDNLKKMVLMELARSPTPLLQSSSSSEEDVYCSPERNKRISINEYMETINAYSDDEFKEHFRLSRATALKLIDLYRPNVKPFRGGWKHISTEKSIYMTIWYLSNMESFRQLGDRFNVTLSCAHHVISSVIQFLVGQSPNFIKWPSENEALRECENFKKKKGLTYIIGAIDGCHIRIHRPTHHEVDFVNRKGYHSMIIQGIVNSKMMFIDIVAGDPGSVHDARVLRKCLVYKKATEEYNILFFDKYCLVGDSAYPSLRWLKVPHKDNGQLNNEQREYNYKHSATRIIIEHAFGLLKGRFRRLRCFENLKQTFIINCVVAACVLHNMCLTDNDVVEEMFFDDEINPAD